MFGMTAKIVPQQCLDEGWIKMKRTGAFGGFSNQDLGPRCSSSITILGSLHRLCCPRQVLIDPMKLNRFRPVGEIDLQWL